MDAALNLVAFAVYYVDAFAREFGDVTFFEINHAARHGKNCGNIGGNKIFILIGVTHANQQRTTNAGADHHARRANRDDTYGIGTVQILHRALRGGK